MKATRTISKPVAVTRPERPLATKTAQLALILSIFSLGIGGLALWFSYASGLAFISNDVQTLNDGRNGKPFRVLIKLTNNGKTLATDVRAQAAAGIYDLTTPFKPDVIEATTLPVRPQIHPGETIAFINPDIKAGTPEAMEGVHDGKMTVWLYGKIGFRDFLGRQHEKRWCYMSRKFSKDEPLYFISCGTYNDAY